MTRTIKLRTVTTMDMEMIVGDEYPTGPLSPTDRKKLREMIERDTIQQAKGRAGVKIIDVSVKRAFVLNSERN